MQSSAATVSRHLPTHPVFHTCKQLSEKFFAGVLPYRFRYLTPRPMKTGTKACTFRKAPYAYPTSGIVITTGRYSAMTQTISDQSDTLTNMENFHLGPSKQIRQDMSHSAPGDGSA